MISLLKFEPRGVGGSIFSCSWIVLVSALDRKSTRLNSSLLVISYAVFCLKKKNIHVGVDVVHVIQDALHRLGCRSARESEECAPIEELPHGLRGHPCADRVVGAGGHPLCA